MSLRTTVAGVLFGLSLVAVAAWAHPSALGHEPNCADGHSHGECAACGSRESEVATPRFSIHGVVRSGSTKLPGVSITAAHSLTGRKVITSTDVDGYFHLDLPSKGRWVLRAEFSAFAVQTAEVVLTPEQADAAHDFELVLLSRVPKTTNSAEEADGNGSGRQRAAGSPAAAGSAPYGWHTTRRATIDAKHG